MKKIFLLTLLLFSFLLIGCNKIKNTTNNDTLVGINKPISKNISTPSLILGSNSISTSPYLYLGNLIFFPDKENNNHLSTIEPLTSSGYIQQSNIKDIFQYPTESIATINNIVYFSNGSDGNSLYSLDYERNEIKKINNNYIFNLTANLNTLYYINKNDNNKLYFYSLDNSTSGILINDSFGKFIITGEYILYQNLSDKANLYSVKLDGSNRMKLTDVSIDSFIPYKNEIIYIDSDDNNILYKLNPVTFKVDRLNLVHGENIKTFNDTLFIIDKDKSNSLSALTVDFEKNTASTSVLTSDTINNYYPTSNGIFLEKTLDVTKTYMLK